MFNKEAFSFQKVPVYNAGICLNCQTPHRWVSLCAQKPHGGELERV